MTVDERGGEPFLASRFRVAWDGRTVSGVVAVSALRWSLQETRIDSLAAVSDAVRLERERGFDDAFEAWAELARDVAGRGPRELRARAGKDVEIELVGGLGATIGFVLRGCTPQAYLPVAGLDAASAEPAREVLVLDCARIEPMMRR